MKTCGTCKHWECYVDLGEDDDPGTCNWMVPVPITWRWCLRERVGSERNEGQDCPTWEQR